MLIFRGGVGRGCDLSKHQGEPKGAEMELWL